MAKLLFRQLFERESSTYTYVLADLKEKSHPAVIIDPVDSTAQRDAALINELNLDLLYALNTHVHADHISGTNELRSKFPSVKSVISGLGSPKASADITVRGGERIKFGSFELEVLNTPGHTDGCVSYVLHGPTERLHVFTGDALLIRGCGRTDFQSGNAQQLYHSAWDVLFQLPDDTIVYPAHDYKGHTSSTIGEERELNPRFTKSEEDFISLMHGLNLPYPKKIKTSLPANLNDGVIQQTVDSSA